MHLRNNLTLNQKLMRAEMHLQNLVAFKYFYMMIKKHIWCIKKFPDIIDLNSTKAERAESFIILMEAKVADWQRRKTSVQWGWPNSRVYIGWIVKSIVKILQRSNIFLLRPVYFIVLMANYWISTHAGLHLTFHLQDYISISIIIQKKLQLLTIKTQQNQINQAPSDWHINSFLAS